MAYFPVVDVMAMLTVLCVVTVEFMNITPQNMLSTPESSIDQHISFSPGHSFYNYSKCSRNIIFESEVCQVPNVGIIPV